jgi:hypothetical protein
MLWIAVGFAGIALGWWLLRLLLSLPMPSLKKLGRFVLWLGALALAFVLIRLGLLHIGTLVAVLSLLVPLWQRYVQQRRVAAASATPKTPRMARAEALRVLGLEEGVSAEEIEKAHKRLIRKNHPDQGGSDFLAAQINEARDVLLGD